MSRQSDHQFEAMLKHELRQSGTPDRNACVDAETLGAWADGGLDVAQLSLVELHVSSCARCQAIVGAAARSSPTVAPVVRERAFRFPAWALAPLAAAAAVTIWMVVPQTPTQAPPAVVDAEAAKKESAPVAGETAVQQKSAEVGAVSEPAPPSRRAETFADGKRERRDATPPPLKDRDQRAEQRSADSIGAVAAAPPAAPAPATPAAAGAPAETVLQKSARLAAPRLEITSPDQSNRWRIVNNSIERSEDGGASWVPIRAAGGEVLTGGVSPSRLVCWLIGSNGVVMVSADGVAFARVPLPERVDLAAITAADARTATVTTTDGRRFRTDDSGRTWRQP